MNEGGRGELVNLPNGSQVIPHDVSMKYAKEAGKASMGDGGYRRSSETISTRPQIIELHVYADIDGKELSREIAEPVRVELNKIEQNRQIIKTGRKRDGY